MNDDNNTYMPILLRSVISKIVEEHAKSLDRKDSSENVQQRMDDYFKKYPGISKDMEDLVDRMQLIGIDPKDHVLKVHRGKRRDD